MARITRSSFINWMQRALGIEAGIDAVPQYTAGQVVPVFDIQPKNCTVQRHYTKSSTGTQAIYTTPTDKDFYLTHASLASTNSALWDGSLTYISITQDGATRLILILYQLTTTAGTQSTSISFPYPIKVDRGTAINLVMSFAAGTQSVGCTIGGYVLE